MAGPGPVIAKKVPDKEHVIGRDQHRRPSLRPLTTEVRANRMSDLVTSRNPPRAGRRGTAMAQAEPSSATVVFGGNGRSRA